MIDFTKILFLDIDVERLLRLDILDFKTEVSERTGVLANRKIAEYHFCKIVIYDKGVVLFTGSIHKLWNSINNIVALLFPNPF